MDLREREALEASRASQQCDPESAIVLPWSPVTRQSNPEGYYGDKMRYVYKEFATVNTQKKKKKFIPFSTHDDLQLHHLYKGQFSCL